jgi:hypothetical protein
MARKSDTASDGRADEPGISSIEKHDSVIVTVAVEEIAGAEGQL